MNPLVSILRPLLLIFLLGTFYNPPSATAATKRVAVSSLYYLDVSDPRGRDIVCYVQGARIQLGSVVRVRRLLALVEVGNRRYRRLMSKNRSLCLELIDSAECDDGRDNDGDGLWDYPEDPGCNSEEDDNEVDGSNDANDDPPSADPAPPEPTPPTSTPNPSPTPSDLAVFSKPFAGAYSIGSMFDHQYPLQFVHYDGIIVTTTGETTGVGVDGHSGYDFSIPEGTEILAAYDGVVEHAGDDQPFLCPLLNQTVVGRSVRLSHTVGQESFTSRYLHLNSVNVAVGQRVTSGTLLGLSGNTGCSTGPHLHFDILRLTNTNDGRHASVDPFGWSGNTNDPWALHSSGSQSLRLWKAGAEPSHYRFTQLRPNPGANDNAWLAVTKIQYAGFLDEQNLNNEYVEVTLDPRFAPQNPLSIGGYSVRNNAGEQYTFPAGFTLSQDRPVRIYSGAGTNTTDTLYWNRSTPAWSNNGDCARLLNSSSRSFYRLSYGAVSCTAALTQELTAGDPPPSDDNLLPGGHDYGVMDYVPQ